MITRNPTSAVQTQEPHAKEAPFGVNEIRLSPREWLIALLISASVVLFTPWVWQRNQEFKAGPNYRIPYSLSNDYWLYQQRVDQVVNQDKVILIGDSVIWGEYVTPDGALSHFLNEQSGASDRFVNLGVNGLFPLAQEGIIQHYGQSLKHEKILIQFNPLWLTSPQADLSVNKTQRFNHSKLVPQFWPIIPCYSNSPEDRTSVVVQRHVPFLQWVDHIQYVSFGGKDVPRWTLSDDGDGSQNYPNAYRNPLPNITLTVPLAPDPDPDRGASSPRHRPWNADGTSQTRFQWVNLEASVQWSAFQRLALELRSRGNSVFVLIGPFNEHLMTPENRNTYLKLRDEIGDWLNKNQFPFVKPEVLPSELYADASHPLTEGYWLLAKKLLEDPQFQNWNK